MVPNSPPSCSRAGLLLLTLGLLAIAGATAVDSTQLGAVAAPGTGRKLLQTDYEQKIKDAAKAAAEWCKGSEIKKRTCGWADQDELGKTVETCEACGTLWGHPHIAHDIPFVYNRCRTCGGSSVLAPQFTSLACRPGKLVVRAVWKLLAMPQNGGAPAVVIRYNSGAKGVDSDVDDNIRRCQLDLPSFKPGGDVITDSNVTRNEVDASLKSKETNCEDLVKGHERRPEKLPKKEWYSVGRWYSDTFHYNFAGCAAVSKPGAAYIPSMSTFVLSTVEVGPKLLLAKFEVREAN